MSKLLAFSPYSERQDNLFLNEINDLHELNSKWSDGYARIFPDSSRKNSIEDLPYVHVGVFKHLSLKTNIPDSKFSRNVQSSSTSGKASTISTDEKTSQLQSVSSHKILEDFIGEGKRPLLVLDSSASLRQRSGFSARIMAALSLKPFSTDLIFLLENSTDSNSILESRLECGLKQSDDLIIYGFSWILWLAWAQNNFSEELKSDLTKKRITFVHSGGWKKLENLKVSEAEFNEKLLSTVADGSKVVDYYGLVEQMGVIYPKCEKGFRHVPIWADILIRNPFNKKSVENEIGQIQLLNTITFGSPSFSVLTEDLGRIIGRDCDCGRKGKYFELIGRVPRSEVRGCSNV